MMRNYIHPHLIRERSEYVQESTVYFTVVFFFKGGWSEAMDLYKEECYSFMMRYSTFLGVLLPFQRTFALPLHSNTAAAPCESIRFVSVSKLSDLHNVFLSTYTLVEYTQDL